MVQVLGQPDDKLLNRALYSHRFFKVVYRHRGITWELLVEYHSSFLLAVFLMSTDFFCSVLNLFCVCRRLRNTRRPTMGRNQ